MLGEIVGTAVSKRNYPNERHRRSLRLQGYDYSAPASYFVTNCAKSRSCLFGDIVKGEMRLNEYGRTVLRVWDELPENSVAESTSRGTYGRHGS